MSTVAGLADRWEADKEVRTRLREEGSLFKGFAEANDVSITIKNAQKNIIVLLPLVQTLHDGEGGFDACTVPALQEEFPGCKKREFTLCVSKILRHTSLQRQ